METKIYVSMPITGYFITERKKTAEQVAKEISTKYNCEVVTPFTAAPYDKERSWEECMRLCVKAMLDCTRVVFLKGWEKSRGCIAEHFIALNCGLIIGYYGKEM